MWVTAEEKAEIMRSRSMQDSSTIVSKMYDRRNFVAYLLAMTHSERIRRKRNRNREGRRKRKKYVIAQPAKQKTQAPIP